MNPGASGDLVTGEPVPTFRLWSLTGWLVVHGAGHEPDRTHAVVTQVERELVVAQLRGQLAAAVEGEIGDHLVSWYVDCRVGARLVRSPVATSAGPINRSSDWYLPSNAVRLVAVLDVRETVPGGALVHRVGEVLDLDTGEELVGGRVRPDPEPDDDVDEWRAP